MMKARYPSLMLAAVLALLLSPIAAFAQQYDPTTSGNVTAGHGKWVVTVTAGPSGAPNGFVVWWMKKSDFDLAGNWFPSGNSIQASVYFDGAPTLNTWGGTVSSFQLAPNQQIKVELGDLFDETGLSANALALQELQDNTQYIFCSWAIGDGSVQASAWSNNVIGTTTAQGVDCQFTQGFWKNHPDDWPVNSLVLGNVNYTKQQLLDIFNQPAQGNGLLILGHQLIATLLNVAAGADATPVQTEINNAHAIIGNLVIPPIGADSVPPNQVSATSQVLDDFNNGIIQTTCGATPTIESTWGRVKSLYR